MKTNLKKNIKIIKTYNGVELCNSEIDVLCSKYGIKTHKTIPYTPQHNGDAKRMNTTLLEKVRCRLSKVVYLKNFAVKPY